MTTHDIYETLDSLIIEKIVNYRKPLEFCQIFDGLVYKEAKDLEEDFSSMGQDKPAYKVVSRRLQFLRESNKIKYNPKWNKGWEVVSNVKH